LLLSQLLGLLILLHHLELTIGDRQIKVLKTFDVLNDVIFGEFLLLGVATPQNFLQLLDFNQSFLNSGVVGVRLQHHQDELNFVVLFLVGDAPPASILPDPTAIVRCRLLPSTEFLLKGGFKFRYIRSFARVVLISVCCCLELHFEQLVKLLCDQLGLLGIAALLLKLGAQLWIV